jgi:hypothetical protein
MTRVLLSAFILTLVLSTVSYSQQDETQLVVENNSSPKETIKIDEFGKATEEDISARIDNLFIQLNNNLDFQGYVITYKGGDFLPSDYDVHPNVEAIRKAIAFRRYDESRLVFIDGGFRKEQATEFWMVPPGGVIPVPTETVDKPTLPKDHSYLWGKAFPGDNYDDETSSEFVLPEVKARLAEEEKRAEEEAAANQDPSENGQMPDEVVSEQAGENTESDEEQPLSKEDIDEQRFSWANEKFGNAISADKTNTGVIILYADDQYYDVNKLMKFIEDGRDRIAKASKLNSNQISVVFGGYRPWIQAEFWVVPDGAGQPLPSPEDRPVEDTANTEN